MPTFILWIIALNIISIPFCFCFLFIKNENEVEENYEEYF